MTQIPSALLEPPAPPAPTGKEPPGSPPPDTPFSTVLDDHQARTAVAEGHDRAEQQDATLAALLGGVPLPAGVTRAVAARLPVASSASQQPIVRMPASVTGLPGAPAVPAAGAASPMPTGPAIPVAAAALPLRPGAVARPVAAQPAIEAGAPPALPAGAARALVADAPAAPAVPNAVAAIAHALRGAATADASASSAGSAPAAAPAPSGPSAMPAPGARPATAASANGHAGAQPAAATPAPVAAAPADAPAAPATDPAEPAVGTPGVGLDHAVETVRLALRAAAERGVSHARISLTPRELGTIEVHLRQTADGLVARVVAQHAAAAQLLQDSGADLRRQLEQSGLTLLRLDIGASGEQAGRSGRDALADGGTAANGDGGSHRDAPTDDPLAPLDGASETTATATLALPNGALVDVLA
jgi:flagellar hook-length control protein FliK